MCMENTNRHIDRRTFLKAGAAGAAVAASGLGFAEAPAEKAGTPAYRTLGRTGMKLSVIGIGALKTAEPAIFQAGFDRGINFVDTARVYMQGRNERIVGEALEGYRDQVYVVTKVWPGTKEEMEQSIAESLKELKVDYVDLLQLHSIRTTDAVTDEVFREVLSEARKKGQTRFIGVSTHTLMPEIINAVVDDPDKFWDMVLVSYNFKSDPKVKEAIARAGEANIGVIAMKTQAGGYETDRFGDVSPHQAALRWVLNDPNVTAAIPGIVNLDQIKENAAVMGMKLTKADLETLEQYGQAIEPYYCHRCQSCAPTCPMRVDIAEVNRSLMYAEGYRDLDLAQSTYRTIPKQASAATCGDCPSCTARCIHGLDLTERMGKARELFA